MKVFLAIYWLNSTMTCISKGCWFLLTSYVPQLHPLFSPHYMFFHNMLSGTQCTQCCCDYVSNGFISSPLISILGITYRLNVMLCSESPNIPFTVFRMRFSRGKLDLMCMCMLWPLIGCRRVLTSSVFFLTGARLVIYDNSCNLHSYCLNRDPVFFKNSQFLVDRLHWRDHTGT